ncbi:ATP-binding protein [Limnofasciculus baicalensis]|uniref:Circadian input-output histidine kinase CikA n=1 Tax=Limnofasciculus baicalensis BBK-W-15 TaxID=2699891 RepID=A0AAE3GU53_9CYAN|nr:ATP-binding protein [Limnofasciculus baicalensis]MCP2728602.1 ATP-binding protein [Limnofasciculus baicalensis BBK-W-15]
MANPGQSSFRRILLSRLLLLSVPVLLTGVYVTYRKARSTLLETARHNLTESAEAKAENINQSIAALKVNLLTASESVVLQSQSTEAYQEFINRLAKQLPTKIDCIELSDIQTKKIVASTCGYQLPLSQSASSSWLAQEKSKLDLEPSQVYVTPVLPEKSPAAATDKVHQTKSNSQLTLLFSAPIYNNVGQLKYALSIQSNLLQHKKLESGSLVGYPVVISQDGTILAHPLQERIGRNIAQEADVARLESAVKNAIAGRQNFQHLFSFDKNGVEFIAGYTAIDSPVTSEDNQKWTILAVTSLDSALSGLKDIQQVLFILTCCLMIVSFLVTLYVARDIALPVEKLRDYAINESDLQSKDRIPQNFKIRELNELSKALDEMIERIKKGAEEVETAWKEAQEANKLKNEFLASTSHELRTPLNGIIGCIRLVKDGFCDDREEEIDFLQRADDAALHLLGIINDILDIAKMESGKLTVEIEPCDLRKVLDEVINLQEVPIQNKGIEFNIKDLHEVIPIYADPAKLKQVLINVVGNATKFTDSGSITINTRIEPIRDKNQENSSNLPIGIEHSSSCVIVTVRDTGIGIDPAQQSKLFRPFVMVDGTTTRKYGGTGLGLAISRNLMEMMNGTITLFSEGNGKGSIVEITLPIIDFRSESSDKIVSSQNSLDSIPSSVSNADNNGKRAKD